MLSMPSKSPHFVSRGGGVPFSEPGPVLRFGISKR